MQYEKSELPNINTGSGPVDASSVSGFTPDFIPASVIEALPVPDSSDNQFTKIELTETQIKAKAISERRAALIESRPDKTVLIKDLKSILDIRLQALQNEVVSAQKRITKDPHSYSEAVKNFRLLYAEISSLEEISYETLKSRWLELVHGIK